MKLLPVKSNPLDLGVDSDWLSNIDGYSDISQSTLFANSSKLPIIDPGLGLGLVCEELGGKSDLQSSIRRFKSTFTS